MAKDPAFLFYTSDFLTGTTFMNNEEVGKYIRTLCLLHQHGGKLPKEKIETVVGNLSANILDKLETDKDGSLFNKRLLIETQKRNAFCESRRTNIKHRYEATSVEHMNKHMENENENRDVNVIKEKGVIGEKEQLRSEVDEVIADLNGVFGTKYKHTTVKTIELIVARIKEGFTLENFKTVHRKMAQAWGLDNKMRQYLRPITLYSNKFESYLNRPEDIANLTHQQQANLKALAKFNEEIKNDNRSVQSGFCGIEQSFPRVKS